MKNLTLLECELSIAYRMTPHEVQSEIHDRLDNTRWGNLELQIGPELEEFFPSGLKASFAFDINRRSTALQIIRMGRGEPFVFFASQSRIGTNPIINQYSRFAGKYMGELPLDDELYQKQLETALKVEYWGRIINCPDHQTDLINMLTDYFLADFLYHFDPVMYLENIGIIVKSLRVEDINTILNNITISQKRYPKIKTEGAVALWQLKVALEMLPNCHFEDTLIDFIRHFGGNKTQATESRLQAKQVTPFQDYSQEPFGDWDAC
jgi:hypothetical protein